MKFSKRQTKREKERNQKIRKTQDEQAPKHKHVNILKKENTRLNAKILDRLFFLLLLNYIL